MDESDGCPVWAAKTEYISREMALERLTYYAEHTNEGDASHYAYCVAVKEIKELPAADVVVVVWCRDCKYFSQGMAIGMCKRDPDKPVIPVPYYHFCSYGKRREDNHDTAKQ